MGDKRYSIPIFAPMSGSVVDLSQVPDPIYAERMMGDGVAIVPDDGTMFSPVNGYVSVVAEDKHAFGFTTDDGLEILIHLGVDCEIQNDCCAVHVKVNDRVQAGDMIAEFNLAELKKRDINTITPIIICGGLDGKKIEPAPPKMKVWRAFLKEADKDRGSEQLEEFLNDQIQLIILAFGRPEITEDSIDENLEISEVVPLVRKLFKWIQTMTFQKLAQVPNAETGKA